MNFNKLVEEVCVKCRVSKKDIFSLRRDKSTVLARNIIYKVLTLDGYSLNQIGAKIGRDHTTVLWGMRNLTEKDIEYATYLYLKYRETEKINKSANEKIVIKIIMDEVKKLYNSGLKENEIAEEVGISEKRTIKFINLIKSTCTTKQVPDYKKNTYRTIYL